MLKPIPVGFHFKVTFGGGKEEVDQYFQSVSGLNVELETEVYTEGGENRFKHKLPVRTKFSNLVLKRGLIIDTELILWCRKALENFEISPREINIFLLNEKHETIQSWSVVNAYPVKWSVSDFNAEENALVIETLELAFQYFAIVEDVKNNKNAN